MTADVVRRPRKESDPETDPGIDFTIEYGLWGGHYKRLPGAYWRAMFVDRETGQRYAGSDDCPWVAIAWALREREDRRAGHHSMARNEGDKPCP